MDSELATGEARDSDRVSNDDRERVDMLVAKLILSFRDRARRLRVSANITLGLILVSIGSGLALFFFAGRLATSESSLGGWFWRRSRPSGRKSGKDSRARRSAADALSTRHTPAVHLAELVNKVLSDSNERLVEKVNSTLSAERELFSTATLVSTITTRVGRCFSSSSSCRFLSPCTGTTCGSPGTTMPGPTRCNSWHQGIDAVARHSRALTRCGWFRKGAAQSWRAGSGACEVGIGRCRTTWEGYLELS